MGQVAAARFALEQVRPGAVLALRGHLDVSVTADVRLALADAVDDGVGDLLLDLAELTGVDPTGLGVLVGAHRRAGRVGRTLVLLDVPPPVWRVLRITRLDKVLSSRATAACA